MKSNQSFIHSLIPSSEENIPESNLHSDIFDRIAKAIISMDEKTDKMFGIKKKNRFSDPIKTEVY